ncbi:hypothetical protein [Alienimonas chondri]|uniref:Uncharacterized protein n=1 Tax=Alienimonas chondri TaxID=2681879 RepID=A0ABX1VHG4_9PLAN|nr:hypothetical protein [Alienimonas chondri]NNJ26930.1 hypothetical protein [Alienimonas chondri]
MSPARRRRLLAQKKSPRGDRGTDYPASGPAYEPASDSEEPESEENASEIEAPSEDENERSEADDDIAASPAPLTKLRAPEESDNPDAELIKSRSPALPRVRANPGPLPEPLPPRLDDVVRRLRDDLLTCGGDAAALADEICARHRDRLREALGLSE